MTEQFRKYQLAFRGYCVAVILQLDDYYPAIADLGDVARKEFNRAFAQSIRARVAVDPTGSVYENQPYEYTFFLSAAGPEELRGRITELLTGLRSKAFPENSLTIAVGNIKDTALLFAESCREAAAALNYKFILGQNQDLYFGQIRAENQPEDSFENLDHHAVELVTAVKLADVASIRRHLNNLTAAIRAHGASSRVYLRLIVSSVYLQTLQEIKKAECSPEEIFDNPLGVYQKIISQQTGAAMAKELEEVLIRAADFINVKKGRKFYQTITRAQDYLLKNFSREDLSLEEVANQVHMSSCYFSLIFKQETGTTFVDFLTKVRLDKAKELLVRSDARSYEVSYQVGYSNPTYFSTLFKKYVGVSPTEFRNHTAPKKTD